MNTLNEPIKKFVMGQLVRTSIGLGRVKAVSFAHRMRDDSTINIYFVEFENGAKSKWFNERNIKAFI